MTGLWVAEGTKYITFSSGKSGREKIMLRDFLCIERSFLLAELNSTFSVSFIFMKEESSMSSSTYINQNFADGLVSLQI